MTDTVELTEGVAPCPFCGGKASSDQSDELDFDVTCWDCNAGMILCGPNWNNRDAAITAWNTRAPAALSTALGEVDAETEAEIAHAEKMRIVAFLRAQSEVGADIGIVSEKGSTRRAAYGGGSLALKRAADAIEADEHITDAPTLPDRDAIRAEAYEECAQIALKVATESRYVGDTDEGRIRHEGILAGAHVVAIGIRGHARSLSEDPAIRALPPKLGAE